MGLAGELRQAPPGLAGAAEVHHQELELPGPRRTLRSGPPASWTVGERDGNIQADRRVELSPGATPAVRLKLCISDVWNSQGRR